MAVYTTLAKEELETLIAPFGIGPLIAFEGVASGIENTTYFITTDQSDFPCETQTQPLRQYVLTIFEHTRVEDLTFYSTLTSLLALRGLPVPCPLTDADGISLHYFQGKPITICPKVEGQPPGHPDEHQCEQIGKTLAHIHRACLDAKLEHQSPRGLSWLEKCAATLKPLLKPSDQQLLDEIPRFMQLTRNHSNLHQAVIHADLFRDNTLFQGDKLVGIIDFNSAGSGFLMLDLAITVNDWCSTTDGSLKPSLATALLNAYQQVISLTRDEKQLWNDFLRIAAVRFWLSRLAAQLQPELAHRPGMLLEPKNPQHFKNILLQRIHNPQTMHL